MPTEAYIKSHLRAAHFWGLFNAVKVHVTRWHTKKKKNSDVCFEFLWAITMWSIELMGMNDNHEALGSIQSPDYIQSILNSKAPHEWQLEVTCSLLPILSHQPCPLLLLTSASSLLWQSSCRHSCLLFLYRGFVFCTDLSSSPLLLLLCVPVQGAAVPGSPFVCLPAQFLPARQPSLSYSMAFYSSAEPDQPAQHSG